ncbi:MAG TPA: DUF115 domain-containing protein, partial [Spirochaetia bacterium]|nr:DUF115 domain-containing protein [Spirochaetia bacterium]
PGPDPARFLEEALSGLAPERVSVIEWPAAARAFPELYRVAGREIVRVLKENAYGSLTTAASGRQWLRNSISNFLTIDSPVTGCPLDPTLPTVIAASGPSLKRVVPMLARYRNSFNLWALPSSVAALTQAGLCPDCVVATDAGYYAQLLLTAAARNPPLLLMPLSASRGARYGGRRVFFFQQPNFFEEAFFVRAGAPITRGIAHGTVAGSALDLAGRFTQGPIVVGGLDLCYDDIQAHARPHPFDDLAAAAADRFSPAYSRLFSAAMTSAPERIPGTRFRSSRALSVYADSFMTLSGGGRGQAYRLNPSWQAVPGLTVIKMDSFLRLLESTRPGTLKSEVYPVQPYPDRTERIRIVQLLLTEWREACRDGIQALKAGKRTAEPVAGSPLPLLIDFFGGPQGKETESGGQPAVVVLEKIADFLNETSRKYIGAAARAGAGGTCGAAHA